MVAPLGIMALPIEFRVLWQSAQKAVFHENTVAEDGFSASLTGQQVVTVW